MNPTVRFTKLDVGSLLEAGQEPFPEIRRRIDALVPGEGLEVVAPFIPSPLIEMLGSEGYEHELDHEPGGAWVTRFWKGASHP